MKPCVLFNDTTPQLNWGCHATSFFTKKILKDNNFEIIININIYESISKEKVDNYFQEIKKKDIKYIFINGEGSLYEQKNMKGKTMIYFMNLTKSLKGVNTYLVNSGFDLYKKESISSFQNVLQDHRNLKIQLREEVSIANFKKFFPENVIFQPDYLFTIPESFNNKDILKKYNLIERDYLLIGGNSNYYREDRPKYDAVSVYTTIIENIQKIIKKEIIIYASGSEEINWLRQICTKTKVRMISVDKVNWKDAYVILNNAYINISGRYHPSIMCYLGNTPSLLFSANHCKMDGINKMFTPEQIVINSHEIHAYYDFINKWVLNLCDENKYLEAVENIKRKIVDLKKKSILYL